ncbi:MAG TPA: heme ABC transporter permease CcmC [Candidatus Megaira endosymbiont of Hartmannula sinica]|nr:heme ABC transporter permease CcmC [Candidatus Megaera endosymbiont of Hartmannula sinica]
MMNFVQFFFSTSFFYKIFKITVKIISFTIFPLLFLSIYYALFNSPIDYQQKEYVRIMYIHVPSAWMSLMIFAFIGICSLINFIWNLKTPFLAAMAVSKIGAMFTFITLLSGSLWGRPIWGVWWVWDARLTSMLILFLSYVGYIVINKNGFEYGDINRAQKPASLFAIISCINIPIVKYSVNLWYSLHQTSSISFTQINKSSISVDMMKPLFMMWLSFILYSILFSFIEFKTLLNIVKIKRQNDLFTRSDIR